MSCWVNEFHDADMSREFAEVAWNCYKADVDDLQEIPSLDEQRTFVQNCSSECPIGVHEGMDGKKNN